MLTLPHQSVTYVLRFNSTTTITRYVGVSAAGTPGRGNGERLATVAPPVRLPFRYVSPVNARRKDAN